VRTGQIPVADPIERVVQDYFENRPGWTATKLDLGKETAPDFRICHDANCLLCEVKTIRSVRADSSYASPGAGSARSRRTGSTEFWFNRVFKEQLRLHLEESGVSHLPYLVRLDSDDVYVPTQQEQECFFKWIQGELHAIDRAERISHLWRPVMLGGAQPGFSGFYPIRKPRRDNDRASRIQMTLWKKRGARAKTGLEVTVHCYGTLNLDAISGSVERGLRQLCSLAARSDDKSIARIIAIAFASAVGFHWPLVDAHIASLLKDNPDLSAIAVLRWASDATPPSNGDHFLAWLKFPAHAEWIPAFSVYHNSWRADHVRPLNPAAFADRRSIQWCPMR
jgi:hypothetical protein